MTIGDIAAEHDDEFLFECFVNYQPVEICRDRLSSGTILAGRTGAGKTAILRYISNIEERVQEIDLSQMAMDYVSNSDILNFVQLIGGDLDLLFQILWKHVLCIEFIRMKWKIKNEQESLSLYLKSLERILEKTNGERKLYNISRPGKVDFGSLWMRILRK